MAATAYCKLEFTRLPTSEEVNDMYTNRLMFKDERRALLTSLNITYESSITNNGLLEEYFFNAPDSQSLTTYFEHPYFTHRWDFLKNYSINHGNFVILNNPVSTIQMS